MLAIHLPVRRQVLPEPDQHAPRVIDMFQHVGDDDGVEASRRDTDRLQIDVLELAFQHAIDARLRRHGRRVIDLDAEHRDAGVGLLQSLAGGAGADERY